MVYNGTTGSRAPHAPPPPPPPGSVTANTDQNIEQRVLGTNVPVKNDPMIIKICELKMAKIMLVCSNYAKNYASTVYKSLLPPPRSE